MGARNDDISLKLAKMVKNGMLPDVSDNEVDILEKEAQNLFGADSALGNKFATAGVGSSIQTALPNLSKAVSEYVDSAAATVRFLSMGSSVSVGATLPNPEINAPGAYFYTQLMQVINRLGNMTTAFHNGSVNGSTIAAGQMTDYTAAKTAAGGAPKALIFAYGMNDGMTVQFHLNQTYPGVLSYGRKLIAQAQADGADVIILTSPHPHSTRNPWGLSGSTPTYSNSGANSIPADTLAGSVKTITASNGSSVSASHRHLRVNEALRYLAASTGSILIDVEKHWFNAVALYGEDALFDPAEYAHPNLLGHKNSYWKAIDEFINGLKLASVQSGGSVPTRSVFDRKVVGEKLLSMASGATVNINIPASTAGELLIHGSSGGSWHSIWEGSVIASATRVSLMEYATAFTTPGNVIGDVAGSASTLVVTVPTTATGSGGNLSWEYRYMPLV